MVKLALTSGTYQAKSLIADAQACINLYPERNPPDSPFPYTHYLTPGISPLSTAPSTNPVRCAYRASNGNFYCVIGSSVYSVNTTSWALTSLGTITANKTTPVSMADNGLVVVICDGSTNLWAINLADTNYTLNSFAQVTGSQGYGGTRVDYLDTFILLNRPSTNQWYISLSGAGYGMFTAVVGSILTGSITTGGSAYTNGTYTNQSLTGGSGTGAAATIVVAGGIITSVTITTPGINYVAGDTLSASISGGSNFVWTVGTVGGSAFDPTDIATKAGYPDQIQALIVMHREIWLIGTLTTEVWYNAGAADFTFQIMPGVFIEQGCVAPYTICKQDLNTYWLGQDMQGQLIFFKGNDYTAQRISTHAVENIWSQYSTVTDAIAFTYQQEGHTFIVVTFPTADATWVFDEAAQLWHQRGWTDNNGTLHRIRANCYANINLTNIVGDWSNGLLYNMSPLNLTDKTDGNGDNPDGSYPIVRSRSWPALLNEDKRVMYKKFIADMAVGLDTGSIDNSTDANPPQVSMSWSDDRGKTYGNKVLQSLGGIGQYLTILTWWRLGYGRGRVFKLSWSCPAITALNGAFVEFEQAET